MLRDNLLKENVDGEALLWAHGRLLARPETRRILIVLSDGEPVDMATLDVNGDDYLERHLVGVIDDIVHCSPVELHAIGIGHDVNRYYPSAISVASANDLTIELLAKVAKLFEAEGGCPRGGTGVRPGRPAPLPRPARLMDKGLVTLDDFARLPAIAGDGARFAPTPGELGDGALFRHCR
jgi:cobaltochelatase CobT